MATEHPRSRLHQSVLRVQHVLIQYGWVSALIGLTALTLFTPGGDDGYHFYFRPHWPGATAPAWAFLFSSPASSLPWPLPWTVFTIFTVVAALIAHRALGERRWWLVLLNHAFVINIWLGQIEILSMMGVALAWLVTVRRIHPFWFGVAVLLLVTKVQVGALLLVLFTFWIWRDQGIRALLWAALAAAGGIGLTLLC